MKRYQRIGNWQFQKMKKQTKNYKILLRKLKCSNKTSTNQSLMLKWLNLFMEIIKHLNPSLLLKRVFSKFAEVSFPFSLLLLLILFSLEN